MEVAQLKFKGNQKHYELNTAVDSSLENIDGKIQLCQSAPIATFMSCATKNVSLFKCRTERFKKSFFPTMASNAQFL